jgi:Eco57I restriction-modification methylase
VWDTWTSPTPRGGFDAVIGNPPYVRQEHLAPIKRALKARYVAYDGVANLCVYFFEQALRLLRPGGRFAFTATNKWLKAGYAEELRALLAARAWLVSVTDFGHARRFFPGTDVFPSVVCARRPRLDQDAPEQVRVTVVPRDLVRMDALEAQAAEAAFSLLRVALDASLGCWSRRTCGHCCSGCTMRVRRWSSMRCADGLERSILRRYSDARPIGGERPAQCGIIEAAITRTGHRPLGERMAGRMADLSHGMARTSMHSQQSRRTSHRSEITWNRSR